MKPYLHISTLTVLKLRVEACKTLKQDFGCILLQAQDKATALQSIDLESIPIWSHTEDFKIGVHSFLLGAEREKDKVEKKPASSLVVVPLSKAFNGIPPPSYGREVSGPSSQLVTVSQFD